MGAGLVFVTGIVETLEGLGQALSLVMPPALGPSGRLAPSLKCKMHTQTSHLPPAMTAATPPGHTDAGDSVRVHQCTREWADGTGP